MSAYIIFVNLLPIILLIVGFILVGRILNNPRVKRHAWKSDMIFLWFASLIIMVALGSAIAFVISVVTSGGWHPLLALKELLFIVGKSCEAVLG